MTITIEDELVEQVRKILSVRTKADAIRMALKEVIRKKRLSEALTHQGTIEFDLDEETLQRLRDEG
jgi:Arc/MetJ family transcription regulator